MYRRTTAVMGTIVRIEVIGQESDPPGLDRDDAVERAFGWFHYVEASCSRFDEQSEVMRLVATPPGVEVPVSPLLFELVQFALAVATETGGAFDPTVGHRMESLGFNRNYRSGKTIDSSIEPDGQVSYRDVRVDADRKTITLLRPLILDFGGVAKGLAIDMAARELQPFEHFAIDAGGDLYLAGHNAEGLPWSIGIRHPRLEDGLIDSVKVSNRAVCTSGDYERRSDREDQAHHILDPRTGLSADAAASVTVIAPAAMLADSLATAAFVLGPAEGIALLERHGVDGLILSPTLERFATRGLPTSL